MFKPPLAKDELITNTKIYVLVQNPGMDDQEEINSFFGSKKAYERCKMLEEAYPDFQFDVMKRLPDGSLTTEF